MWQRVQVGACCARLLSAVTACTRLRSQPRQALAGAARAAVGAAADVQATLLSRDPGAVRGAGSNPGLGKALVTLASGTGLLLARLGCGSEGEGMEGEGAGLGALEEEEATALALHMLPVARAALAGGADAIAGAGANGGGSLAMNGGVGGYASMDLDLPTHSQQQQQMLGQERPVAAVS